MSRKIRLWYVCGIVALGLFVPSLMLGQENLGMEAVQTEVSLESQAPEGDMSLGEKPITLEELKRMLGPNQVCGAPCGPGCPQCYVSCGEPAFCQQGFCVYW